MAITLDAKRLAYRDYFAFHAGKLDKLFQIPKTLANGLEMLTLNDISTRFNFFKAASDFYANGVLDSTPEALQPHYALFERMVRHWSVTGEYCLVIENGILNTIRPDYVFPVYADYNADMLLEILFVFPNKMGTTARVIRYDVMSESAFFSQRTLSANQLQEAGFDETPVNIQWVKWENTQQGFYDSIQGLVRELNIRMAMFQLSLNSTAIPLLQAATEGISGGLITSSEITPSRIASLGKTGLGLVIPPPFTGEQGASYVERQGTGLREAMDYMRILLGSLSVMSGVPEYVFGTNLSDSAANVERVMFMGQSRINRMHKAIENSFRELGIIVDFTPEGVTQEVETIRVEEVN